MDVGYIPPPSAVHYEVKDFAFSEFISPIAAKIIALQPELILGTYRLFDYNPLTHVISLSPTFKSLLGLLVDLGELDTSVLKAPSLADINTIFQKPQGEGGLLRKPGLERWDLSDNPAKQAHKKQFDDLLEELGFLENKPLTDDVTVNHCVIFGATPMRVETRIEETLSYLNTHLRVTDHIFLLGSNRKLTELEIQFLQSKIEKISDERKAYWQEVFATPEHSIEANSCSFLWEYLTALTPPSKPVNVISIKSTRIGFSYYDTQGHRSTTETTAEDWLKFYRKKEAQTIFAVIEQPFRRLCDQLQETTLTHAKKASLEDLTSRLANTTFHFVTTTPKTPPLISVYLDEVARHVYRIKGIIEYCNSLS